MLLSIVTPTYNRATFKKLKQMRSLRFHFNEFEWIIVVEKKINQQLNLLNNKRKICQSFDRRMEVQTKLLL